MASLKSPADILKLLEKTNCRECGEATCLVFASAVFRGKRRLAECPRLDRELVARLDGETEVAPDNNDEMNKVVDGLKKKVTQLDFAQTAEKVGGQYKNDRLLVRVMGKVVEVDHSGDLYSQIHLNPFMAIPLLSYILHGEKKEATGQWTAWRELPGGREFEGLYRQRIELALNQLVQGHTDLFEDILSIFNGTQVEQHFDSDLSLVLYPFPKVPLLVCYWAPEDGLGSDLKLFFDSTAVDNMGGIRPLYTMTAGMAMMFAKITKRHGFEN